jgi:hypothetical protein
MMRGLVLGAAAVLAACSTGVASAQSDSDHAGTWAFQTTLYGSGAVGAYMSGVAVMTPAAPDRYDIRLMANERLVNRLSGETRLLVAHQTCTGEQTGAQFTITCQLTEAVEGYEPDNFVLQQGEDANQLVGVLNSANDPEVTFTRMR